MKTMFHGLFFLSLTVGIFSCSHKYGIEKAQAYERESVSGTIQVDENGRPRNSGVYKTHLIYIETAADQPSPEWDLAWINGQPYTVKPVEVAQNGISIGQSKDNKEVILNSQPGNKLWQLVLSPNPVTVPQDSTIKENFQKTPIVLTGKWKNKKFKYKISKEEQLATQYGQ
jgi:hypothetical protein